MTSLTKKLTAALLAVAAAVCLFVGLLSVQQRASAVDASVNVETLDKIEYFNTETVESGIGITGLSAEGVAKIGTRYFDLDFTGLNVVRIGAAGATASFLTSAQQARLNAVVFGDELTEISDYAFAGCTGLTAIDLSAATNLTKIGAHAFNAGKASDTTSITIPEGVTSIGNLAFANHNKLTEINFYATNCADFGTSTGSGSSLKADTSAAANNPFYKAAFVSGNAQNVVVNIGKEGGTAVKNIPAYMFYSVDSNPNRIKTVNFVNVAADATFGDYAFANCKSLTTVDLGSSIPVIGRYAFSQCTALSSINIPASVTTIDQGAFNSCAKLADVYWGSGELKLTTIGRQAFSGCTALTSFNIPASVKLIDVRAFSGSGLTAITIPEGVTNIGLDAFSECAGLATINYNAIHASGVLSSPFKNSGNNGIEVYIGIGLTEKIEYIHQSLFQETNITKVEVSNVETGLYFGDNAFRNCKRLTSVKFNSNCNIDSLGNSTFDGCTALQTVVLPNGLTKIGEYAFQNCSALYSVSEDGNGIVIPTGVTSIAKGAFSGCSSVFSVSLPATVTSIGDQAFLNCITLLEVEDLTNLGITEESTDNGYVGFYAKHVYSSGDSYITTDANTGYVIYDDATNKYLLGYVGENTELDLGNIGGEFEIYAGAFKGNLVIERVTVPNRVTKIGQEAFYGCTSLTEITINPGPNLHELGASAFYGCTKLDAIRLPEGISKISDSMFENCSSLSTIDIPSTVQTIGISAFKGCSKLKSVNFKEYKAEGAVDDTDGYKLTLIDANAFDGCAFLTVIKIPNTVTKIGGSAFNGCERLATVYLPDRLDNYGSQSVFAGCHRDLILIAPADNYANYRNAYSDYGDVTYIVEVNLIYGDVNETVERLYNVGGSYGYNFVKQADGSWSANGDMPVQQGYEASVWYKNNGYAEADKVTGATLSQMLAANNVKTINLYARYIAHPDLTVVTAPEYGESTNYLVENVLTGYDSANGYIGVLVSYTSQAGVTTANPATMKDAGEYKIELRIAEPEKYGVWEQVDSLTYTFTIRPQRKDVTQYINFVTSNGSPLGSTDSTDPDAEGAYLYLYGTGTDDDGLLYPYLKEQQRADAYIPAGATSNAISVTNSYVTYNGSESTVMLANNAEGAKYYTVTEYATMSEGSEVVMNGEISVGVKATEQGRYKLEVTLLANNNFRLEYASSANGNLGLQWTQDGNTYTITKTWYIAMADGNTLLNADKTAFSLPVLDNESGTFGWTYGDNGVAAKLAAPTLASTPDKAADLLTFTISNLDVWGDRNYTFGLNEYEDVINYTMPAGLYYLSVTVKADGSYGSENYDNIPFEVLKADYTDKLKGWGVDALYGNLYSNAAEGAVFTVEYNTRVQFADTSALTALDLDPDVIYVREGIWAEDAYDTSYKGFEISYNTDGMSMYYTGNFTGAPVARGRYTVYFNITSSNYKSLVDTTQEFERQTYCYTLYIKETIDADSINLGTPVYTGGAVTFRDTTSYKFVYLNGDDADSQNALRLYGGSISNYNYVNAGSQVVALMINENLVDGYRWAEGNNVRSYRDGDVEKEYVFLNFTIERADNETTQWLNVREWTKYEYSATANRPQWATRYVTNYSDFTFRLQSVKDETDVYYFAPKNNGELSFDDAPAGEYKLIATAAGGEGYNWNVLNVEYDTTVTIHKAKITLVNEPYIASWKYGEYGEGAYTAPQYSFPTNLSALRTDYYIVTVEQYNDYVAGKLTWEAMTRYGDITEMLDEDYHEVPAGDYVYVIGLAEGVELNENYEEWSFAIHFSVVQVRNYWKTTPSVHDWYYGDFTSRDTTIDYEPQFGEKGKVVLQFRRVDENHVGMSGWVTDISKLEFDTNGELSAGIYEMRAMLDGNKNYSDLVLTNMYFRVEKANNSWTTDGVPVVKSWSQGNWDSKDNALMAKSTWGDVEFSVYKASDTKREKAYDISKLNSLGVGSYVLVARVAGTNDYEELVSESTFAVFEDSVGMTGLIAATMVFAVIAIGLAVAGVVMLILRNKKIEEEFRRMIKSELRRK